MLESKGLEGMAGSWEEKVSMILTRNVRYALTFGWNHFWMSIFDSLLAVAAVLQIPFCRTAVYILRVSFLPNVLAQFVKNTKIPG